MAFSGELYLIQFEVTPRQDHPGAGEIAGAFVNCWLYANDSDAAVAQAARVIRNDGWIVGEPDETSVIDLATFEPTAEAKPLVEQVQIDGEVYDFNCYLFDETPNEPD